MPQQRYRATALKRDERPTTFYTYFVTGRGEFPLDMMRYDSAWPASSDATTRIVWMDGQRSVELQSYRAPTEGRWLSFGWSVGLDDLTRPTPIN